MNFEEISYFRRRERQERAAAKCARSLAARRIHQQMAQYYSALLAGFDSPDPLRAMRSCGAI